MRAKAVSYLPTNPVDNTLYYVKSLEKFYIYKEDKFIEMLADTSPDDEGPDDERE